MALQYHSNLDYLMNVLKISNKDLAQAIHVDESLISKWKNKKRKLNSETSQFKKMIDYFIRVDENAEFAILNELFKKQNSDIKTKEDKSLFLSEFISKEEEKTGETVFTLPLPSDSSNDIYDSTVRIFQGNSARREAMLLFLDILINSKESHEIFLISQEDMSWLIEDPEFLKIYNQKLHTVLQKHHLKMIHYVDRNVENMLFILQYWIRLYTHRNIESYYFTRYNNTFVKQTLLIAKEHLALYGAILMENKRYTALYSDLPTVRVYTSIYENFLSHTKPLIISYKSDNMINLIEQIQVKSDLDSEIFFCSPFPLFIHLDREVLIRILKKNAIIQDFYDPVLSFYDTFKSKISNKTKIIYYWDIFSLLSKQATYQDPLLSFLCGQAIVFSREDLKLLLSELLNQCLYYELLEIYFINQEDTIGQMALGHLFFPGNFAIFFDPKIMDAVFYTEEITTVTAFEQLFDGVRVKIPRIKTKKDYNLDLIRQLLSYTRVEENIRRIGYHL